jgi:general secretion pathway protein D
LGVAYPNQIALNNLVSVNTAILSGTSAATVATTTSQTAQQLTIDNFNNLTNKSFSVSPNPSLNFRKTTDDVNLISNPRIRVRNNEKAKVLVGDKVPIITTTSTANVGVSESVTYLDVGLKLDVEPRITLDDFVNIKIELEVSSLGGATTTKNGATVYTIGTRSASTQLRLKDGETQVLAGLILDDERKNASKLPGLGDLPLLGRLFANQANKKSKTEIVLAITPRILANISRPNAEISEYWSGTDAQINDRPQISVPMSGGLTLVRELQVAEPEAQVPVVPKEAILEPLPIPATPTSPQASQEPKAIVPVEPKAFKPSEQAAPLQ